MKKLPALTYRDITEFPDGVMGSDSKVYVVDLAYGLKMLVA